MTFGTTNDSEFIKYDTLPKVGEFIRVLELPSFGIPSSGGVVTGYTMGKGYFVNNISFSTNFTGWCDG